ncbi:DUF3261 domain-containing protein [Chitinimonas koreensis]|nr:DUF3261 domain-containing protein [Chitinimonas koreensis]
MPRFTFHVSLFTAFLLAGCAQQPQRPTLPDLPPLQLAPADFGGSLSLAQRLDFARLDGRPSGAQPIEALLEIDGESVRLAGFALGQRILTLAWDGRQLAVERHPRLPAEVDAARVLRDIELVYWPAERLRAALPAGWTLEDGADGRRLLADGVPVLTVSRTAAGAAATVVLENRREGYRLTIESSPSGVEAVP